jgi:hypothetical protein
VDAVGGDGGADLHEVGVAEGGELLVAQVGLYGGRVGWIRIGTLGFRHDVFCYLPRLQSIRARALERLRFRMWSSNLTGWASPFAYCYARGGYGSAVSSAHALSH